MEFFKYRVVNPLDKHHNYILDSLNIILFLGIIFFLVSINRNNYKKYLIFLSLYILCVEYSLYKVDKFKKNCKTFDEIYDLVDNGDIILENYYTNNSLIKIILFNQINPLINDEYFSHVGLIVKDPKKKKVYILESNLDKFKDDVLKIKKNGPITSDFNRIKSNMNKKNSFIIKTNIGKYYKYNDLMNEYNKYQNLSFTDINKKGLSCVDLVSNILYDLNIIEKKTYLPGHFTYNKLYSKPFKIEKIHYIIEQK